MGLDEILGLSAGMRLLLDIDVTNLAPDHPLPQAHSDWFDWGAASATLRGGQNPEPVQAWWRDALCDLLDRGIGGFRFLHPQRGNGLMRAVIAQTRQHFPQALFIADTPGVAWEALQHLTDCDFDYCLSSLPWWDLRAPWLAEEYAALRRVAPVIAMAEAPGKALPESAELRRTRLLLAAITGSGVLMPRGFNNGVELDGEIQVMNRLAASEPLLARPGALRVYPSATTTIVLRTADAFAEEALVAFIGRSAAEHSDRTVMADLEAWSDLTPIGEGGTTQLFRARRAQPVRLAYSALRHAEMAAKAPRVIIEEVSPTVDHGRHTSKRLVGDSVEVSATIFSDGHHLLAAELLFRAADETEWQRRTLRPLGNDRWTVEMPLLRAGRHRFAITAWINAYGSFVRDLTKKRDADKDIARDLEEGRALVEAARREAPPAVQPALALIASSLAGRNADGQLVLLLSPATLEAMRLAEQRTFPAQTAAYPIDADRKAAGFASWYELFPRSQTCDPARSGTLRDVMAQLPRIAAMGFDVLYLPPIHPIGVTNRKGRNNALVASPGDVGSPYAIGSVEGGHDAIHPELGTLEDFRALVAAAREQGMEVALDFAVQCSPDHPWLKEHPGWFEWRPDGSLKYAENPPKVYEDIVNVDFYAPDAVPGLWLALRDIVKFWIAQGVHIFRVDNPHTKPFAFWEWLIADVRASHSETIFLAEAFTRPSAMYHLGKIGFTQSYTYFTWRNTKAELTHYIEEITKPPVDAFFRPHFFVNTPDINPMFLQNAGRAGFLIRAALATTLSGLWGMFSGFELCEAAALPGREEYLHSDKYAIRPRDWSAPNISAEITQLNRLRKAEPGLQSHLGTTFYNAFNDNVLYYGRYPLGYDHHVLVMVSLDPHNAQSTDFEVPLWEWGLPDDAVLAVEDLLTGEHFSWSGKLQRIRLSPEAPYRIWRLSPRGGLA